MPAPVIVFSYNRPDHTQQTLSALAKNPLFDQTDIYLYADGAPSNASPQCMKQIAEVRQLLAEWANKTNVHLSIKDNNHGLARSIIDGVTETIAKHGRVIVLEDDIVPTEGFLQYMNDALDTYAQEEKVMQVSAYTPPHKKRLPTTGFFRGTNSWGWATWSRAWQHYNDDAQYLYNTIAQQAKAEAFNICPAGTRLEELHKNVTGEIRTWAIRWYASCFLRGGLTLYPSQQLIKNIGFDGTGENCNSEQNSLYNGKLASQIIIEPKSIEENLEYVRCFENFFASLQQAWTHTPLWTRLKRKLKLS